MYGKTKYLKNFKPIVTKKNIFSENIDNPGKLTISYIQVHRGRESLPWTGTTVHGILF